MPAEIQFLRPFWFLALIPLPYLLWRIARSPGAAQVWRGLVDEHLLTHLLADDGTQVRRLPLILLALGWLLGVIALAGPVWERLPQPVFQTEAQRVIVLDISEDMNAQDLPPSRLARARFEVLDMLAQAEEGQTALLAFGAEPFVVSPLTSDADTIVAQVPDLETALMPVRGPKRTDLALEEAGGLLRRAGSGRGDIIVVTDALERPAEAQTVAARLRAEGYRISVLGVGTEKGAPVPLPDGGFLTDDQGAIALPRLKPKQLRALAAAGGGHYVDLRTDDSDTRVLIPRGRDRLSERGAEQDARADQWREEGPWLLLALLPLAALAFRRGWLSPLVLIMLIVRPPSAEAFGWEDLWLRADQQGARAFSVGELEQAAEAFQRPDWRAAAQYESGAYKQAEETLDALEGPEAAYNRGNAMARLGDLQDAVEQYEQVLEQDPDHADARHNRDLLRQLLEQQQEQQQQPQSQKGDQGEDEQRNDSEQQGQDGQEGQQGQDGPQDQSSQEGQNEQENQGEQRDPGDQQGDSQDGQEDEQKRNQSDDQPGGGSEQSPQEQPAKAQDSGDGTDQQLNAPSGQGEQEPSEQGMPEAAGSQQPQEAEATGTEPDLDDLLGGDQAQEQSQAAASAANAGQESSEGQQAMEHMLRRVPDDPGGLLRQRFLLQHLRRSGRLP